MSHSHSHRPAPPNKQAVKVKVDTSPAGRHTNHQLVDQLTTDLDRKLASLRRNWQQAALDGADRVDFTAALAIAFTASRQQLHREGLASLLAVAMCRLLWQEVDP